MFTHYSHKMNFSIIDMLHQFAPEVLAHLIYAADDRFAMNENERTTLQDRSEEQLATDPRIAMRRMTFEFLLQQEYFATAAMMVAEFIGTIQRLEDPDSCE